MIYSLIRAVVTNNRNDGETVVWCLPKTEDEDMDFRDHQQEAVTRWNSSNSPGIMSNRYISFDIFYPDDFETLTLDKLDGIPLSMLKKVLDHIPTTEKETS